jgi:CheY-like chemotaxis protein
MSESLAKQLAALIPYLRRFARALTGSQTSGDAYVAAVLETIVADPGVLDRRLELRVALYKAFCNLWQSLDVNMMADTPSSAVEQQANRRLSVIAPRHRQAFLLRTVEEFTLEETAEILGVSSEETNRLIDEVGSEIAAQMATDVLIIEDEPVIAMDIETLVTSLGHRVSAIARTRDEAVAAAHKHRPGLVLADIQLADGSSGLDAVNDMLKSYEVPVIFITAYPERLLTGEKPEPAFLITKPFQPDMVTAIISQALFFEANAHGAASGQDTA